MTYLGGLRTTTVSEDAIDGSVFAHLEQPAIAGFADTCGRDESR